ncbi:histidine kinase [Sandarakinorhabdus sp. DWP1-3-1]|uniref:histidine kinase n=1 Tax=Sandarakinorhabdus sp. DWP1-3-1 TaxID=2804627 RepID=UPI003CF3AB19
MRRALALGVALLALVAAGFLWTRDRPVALAALPPPPAVEDSDSEAEPGALTAPRSDVTPAEREARRFARVDKDRDDRVSRDEYLATRKKAFARLDSNGDGRVSFEEYAARTVEKFARADRDGDGALAAPEFATTAVKRKPKPACRCPAGGG